MGLLGCLSGCHFKASLRYAERTSDADEVLEILRMSYGSISVGRALMSSAFDFPFEDFLDLEDMDGCVFDAMLSGAVNFLSHRKNLSDLLHIYHMYLRII